MSIYFYRMISVTEHDGVRIAPSLLAQAGDGLFATRDHKRGDRLLTYRYLNGKHGPTMPGLTKAQFDAKYTRTNTRPTHVFYDAPHQIYWDGSSGGLAAKMNTNPNAQNARFDKVGNVILTRTVRAGDEIYVSYGASYGRV